MNWLLGFLHRVKNISDTYPWRHTVPQRYKSESNQFLFEGTRLSASSGTSISSLALSAGELWPKSRAEFLNAKPMEWLLRVKTGNFCIHTNGVRFVTMKQSFQSSSYFFEITCQLLPNIFLIKVENAPNSQFVHHSFGLMLQWHQSIKLVQNWRVRKTYSSSQTVIVWLSAHREIAYWFYSTKRAKSA